MSLVEFDVWCGLETFPCHNSVESIKLKFPFINKPFHKTIYNDSMLNTRAWMIISPHIYLHMDIYLKWKIVYLHRSLKKDIFKHVHAQNPITFQNKLFSFILFCKNLSFNKLESKSIEKCLIPIDLQHTYIGK